MLNRTFTQSISIIMIAIWMTACSFPMLAIAQASTEQTHRPLQIQLKSDVGDKPLIAILAANSGAETTDFMVPYGVFKESGVADVITVSTEPGIVHMHPALRLRLEQTIVDFDQAYPQGADIVIVPAMHHPDDPAVLQWITEQYQSGAIIVGICEGVRSLAFAGLLKGHSATTHWHALPDLERSYPDTSWVRNSRYVADRQIVTSTGVSASIPVSLALVEAIAGTDTAMAVANRLGVKDFDAAHNSDAFQLGPRLLMTAAINWTALWRHEKIIFPVFDGVDEIALALSADAWSRTYRSSAIATHGARDSIHSKRGLIIEIESSDTTNAYMPHVYSEAPLHALDSTLADIAQRYGPRTAEFVAVQLEYPH
jgi:putative intracellular protease/amidase